MSMRNPNRVGVPVACMWASWENGVGRAVARWRITGDERREGRARGFGREWDGMQTACRGRAGRRDGAVTDGRTGSYADFIGNARGKAPPRDAQRVGRKQASPPGRSRILPPRLLSQTRLDAGSDGWAWGG